MRVSVKLLLVCLVIGGCAHSPVSQNENFKEVFPEQVDLKLTGDKGFREAEFHYYQQHQKGFKKDQIAHETDQTTTFTIQNEILDYIPDKQVLRIRQSTLSKDGPAELTALSFPDVGTSIDFTFDRRGQVLEAGAYPTKSIFFVAPMPLPDRILSPGETWSYKATWADGAQGMEYLINLIGVLERVYECYKSEYCYRIRYEGKVELPATVSLNVAFESHIKANFLVRPKNFSVLSSEVRSSETYRNGEQKMESQSCLVSSVTNPNPKCEL